MSLFSESLRSTITGLLSRYETRRSAILPVLHAIQDDMGWISEEAITELQAKYDLHEVDVREVLTFYSMYRQEKPAKYTVLFCDNIVCRIMGSKEAICRIEEKVEALKKEGKGELLSVQGVPCLGVCGGAPAMLVNKDRHLNVTAQNVDELIDRYVKKG